MKRRRKSTPIDAGKFEASSLVSRAEAVQLIAQTVRHAWDSDKQARNRVSKRFSYAATNGSLPRVVAGKFVFGELAAWAQDTWKGHFKDWPATRLVTGTMELNLGATAFSASGTDLPQNLQEAHQRIIQLTHDYTSLQSAYVALQREVDELRPYKRLHEERIEKGRIAGKKGGRGRSK